MKIQVFLFFGFFLLLPLVRADASPKSANLDGRILLQVESHGEAWYVNPKDSKRYYLADGEAAFRIMKNLGVGISNKDLDRIKTDASFRKKFLGKIFLQVESHGEAYYISFDGRYNYLKDGASAYEVMRKLGLGITTANLDKITSAPAGTSISIPAASTSTACSANIDCEKYRGVEISWQLDADAFSGPTSYPDTSGQVLDVRTASATLKILKKALDKYPEGILNRYLHRIYLLKNLHSGETAILGTVDTFKRNLYLINSDRPEKTEETLHHELAHLIYTNKNIYYPEFESLWESNNPVNFSYDDVNANPHPGESITAFKTDLAENGFVSYYAETNFNEDFAVMASQLFKDDPISLETDFWTLLDTYSRIKEKFNLTVAFYTRLNPVFTEDYFRKVSKQ